MSQTKLLNRLNELIKQGTDLGSASSHEQIDETLYDRWTLNYENLLALIYSGVRLVEVKTSIRRKHNSSNRLGIVRYVTSRLEATKDDLEKGIIGEMEFEIKKVEINSLLDYSFQLLDENDDAIDRCACVLARIVLEKSLRILCGKNKLDSSQKADKLNQQLRDKEIYSKSKWRLVQSLLDVGNAAAHSNLDWDKIGKNERQRMVENIQTFVRESL